MTRSRTAPQARASWLALLVLGCVSAAHAGLMLVSEKDEIAIGKEVAANSEKEYGGVLNDPTRQARLARVTAKIMSQRKRVNIPYTFKILNNDEVINAFAAPGGPFYITKKLFDMCETDGKLAFIVGHEFAHTELQHGRKAINKAVLAQVGFQILLGKSSEAVKIGVGIAYNIIDSGYSRDQERDADAWGVRYMARGGWDPNEAIRSLEMLGGGKHKGLSKYFASHPATPERIERVRQQIAAEFPEKVRPSDAKPTTQPTPPTQPKPDLPRRDPGPQQKPPTPSQPSSGTGKVERERSPVAGQQGFLVASDPGGAEVWIDGARAGVTPVSSMGTLSQYKFFPVHIGTHAVVIKKAGAGEWQVKGRDQVVRKDEGKRLTITLGNRTRVTLRVDSAPRPVYSIDIGGERVCRGSGPGTIVLPRGTRTKYPVTVRMNFQQATGWISVPDKDEVSLVLTVRGSSLRAREG